MFLQQQQQRRIFFVLLLFVIITSYFFLVVEGFGSSVSNSNNRMTSSSPPGTTTTTTTPSPSSSSSSKTLGADALRELVLEAAELDDTQQQDNIDLKGIVWLEHINIVVGCKKLAQRFYLDLLGLSKDKSPSFHCNLGQQQFHLAEIPGEPAQRVTGSIGLVVPSIETVRERIETALLNDEAEEDWKDTQLQIIGNTDDSISSSSSMTVICPWGNRLHLYDAQAELESLKPTTSDSSQKMVKLHGPGGIYSTSSRMTVRGNPGIRYVELICPRGSTPAIAEFYRTMFGGCTVTEPKTTTTSTSSTTRTSICVCVGPGVHLVYAEEEEEEEEGNDDVVDYDAMKGVHICIYVTDFKQLYDRLKARNLIWTNPRFTHLDTCDTWEEAMASRTLRFKDIIDLSSSNNNDDGDDDHHHHQKKILEFEHETRPMRHGQYLKVPFYEPR